MMTAQRLYTCLNPSTFDRVYCTHDLHLHLHQRSLHVCLHIFVTWKMNTFKIIQKNCHGVVKNVETLT